MQALADLSGGMPHSHGGVLAITGATLIDGTGRPPVHDAVILVEGGRIRAAGPRGKVKIPAGATRFDATGRFVLPGLWDTHAHFEQVEWGPLYLAAGITTARDCGKRVRFHYRRSRRHRLRPRTRAEAAAGRHHRWRRADGHRAHSRR
jgi:cytosine/adenosine deaminase-related metal-dependent hydrolase